MPRKIPKVKKFLTQLRKEELLKLAKKRKVRIPSTWSKPKIAETLSIIVSEKDVLSLLSKKVKPEAIGYQRKLWGEQLEKKVVSKFSRQGFKCDVNVRVRGAEFDVIGYKEGGWFSEDKWVFVECKNKPKVIPKDFKKFVGNFSIFKKRKKLDDENVTGYLITTGVFDPDVKSFARKFPNIKLERDKVS